MRERALDLTLPPKLYREDTFGYLRATFPITRMITLVASGSPIMPVSAHPSSRLYTRRKTQQ